MKLDLDFLTKLTGDREVAKKFLNPTISNYQRMMEFNGWEFVDNHSFRSMLDELEDIQQISGENIHLVRESLEEKMKRVREWYKQTYSTEEVFFGKSFDVYGNEIPQEELISGVYVKRRVI